MVELGKQWSESYPRPRSYQGPQLALVEPTNAGWDAGREQRDRRFAERERGGWGNPAEHQHYQDARADPPLGYYRTGEAGTAQRVLPGMEMTSKQHVGLLVRHLNEKFAQRRREEGYDPVDPMVEGGSFVSTGRDARLMLQLHHHPESPFHPDQWSTGDPDEDHWHQQSYGGVPDPAPQAVLDWTGYTDRQPGWEARKHRQGEIKEASIGGLHGEGGQGAEDWKGHGVMSAMFTTARRIAAEHPDVAEPRHSPLRTEQGVEWSQSQMRKHGEEVW